LIFVTVGSALPFDRLLHWLALPRDELLVVQHGASSVRPGGATCVAFMGFEEIVRQVQAARVVVCHAGVGSILVALQNGKRPIVVPRLRRFGEAPDDHQEELASRLAAEGLVTLAADSARLHELLASDEGRTVGGKRAGAGLVGDLSRELRGLLNQG